MDQNNIWNIWNTFMTIFVVGFIAFMLYAAHEVNKEAEKCDLKGGILVQIVDGYACIDKEVILKK